jgi:hypothetical protein
MNQLCSLLAITAVAACSDNITRLPSPTAQDVIGSYHANGVFRGRPNESSQDLLTRGSHITITLAPDGTVSGDLLLVGAADGAGDLTADMAGTWRIERNTVRLDQAANTFMRTIPFLCVCHFQGHPMLSGFFTDASGFITSVSLLRDAP